jgi:RluA family pseudouridine synthase
VAKTNFIELPGSERIPILYEDRSVMVIDKPSGWMLAPLGWHKTSRNLQAALGASLLARDFWARSRNLNYLRFVHRLDAGTSGLLLLAKSPGALSVFSRLFEGRKMEKRYLAVVHGAPRQSAWTCQLKLAPVAGHPGKMKVEPTGGKEAETHFRLLQQGTGTALVEARPLTGRTHQIRVHLAATGHPVVGDDLYGKSPAKSNLALRAVGLSYLDPFTRRPVQIRAPSAEFVREYGFEMSEIEKGKDLRQKN